MNCPECNQPPISRLKFTFNYSFGDIRCKNCSAILSPGETLRRIYTISIVLGLLVGAFVIYLKYFHLNNTYSAIFVFLALTSIIGLPLDHYAYKHGKFYKK